MTAAAAAGSDCGEGDDGGGCFNCNICLEFAAEPVVTLCGHLFCWPCVYRWLRSDRGASRQCPVCKNPISEECLVPLYGRGTSRPEEGRPCKGEETIPRRPSVVRRRRISTAAAVGTPGHRYDLRFGRQHILGNRSIGYPFHSSAGGVLAEMALAVLPWMCRDHAAAMVYTARQQHLMLDLAGGSRAQRRQMMMERSLHHLWLLLLMLALIFLLLY